MKRNLFDELKEGFYALHSAREGKVTLRQHVFEKKPAPSVK
jgi:putative transcriptional regulator